MLNINLTPLIVLAVIGITLGLWKIVEIIIWFFSHVQWTS